MYVVISYIIGLVCGVMALSGVAQGNGGGAIFFALLAAFFIWVGRSEQVKRQKKAAQPAKRQAPAPKPRMQGQLVTVAFRDPKRPNALRNFSPEHGYVYLWPFEVEPKVGDWAIAPGMSGPAPVVVGLVGVHPDNDWDGTDLAELIAPAPHFKPKP